MRENSFQINGARLFNSLPLKIRNMKYNQEDFKLALDNYLCSVPDQPRTKTTCYHKILKHKHEKNGISSIHRWARFGCSISIGQDCKVTNRRMISWEKHIFLMVRVAVGVMVGWLCIQ